MFPWAPVSNLALSAVGCLLVVSKSMFIVTKISSAGRARGSVASTVIDSNVIVSN